MKRSSSAKTARSAKTIRILLADKHAILVDALRVLLESQPDMKVVGVAANGPDAVHLASKLHPDIAIVAIDMPGMNGMETARQIRKLALPTKILILSMHSSAEYVYEAFRAGADGYVVKESRAAELIEALLRISMGGRYMSEAISSLLIDEVAGERGKEHRLVEALTERERAVLQLIVAGKSSAAAAESLGLSRKTIECYRSRIMSKLEIHDVPGLVKFAIRHGLAPLE